MAKRAGKVEREAKRLVDALHHATEGRPMQWRSLDALRFDAEGEAVRHAVGEGWIEVVGGHSVCLTDKGRQLSR